MEWELKENYSPVISEKFQWSNWAENKEDITGNKLLEFINELFKTLKALDFSDSDKRKKLISDIFSDIDNYMNSGIELKPYPRKVDFIGINENHPFNDLYEGM